MTKAQNIFYKFAEQMRANTAAGNRALEFVDIPAIQTPNIKQEQPITAPVASTTPVTQPNKGNATNMASPVNAFNSAKNSTNSFNNDGKFPTSGFGMNVAKGTVSGGIKNNNINTGGTSAF